MEKSSREGADDSHTEASSTAAKVAMPARRAVPRYAPNSAKHRGQRTLPNDSAGPPAVTPTSCEEARSEDQRDDPGEERVGAQRPKRAAVRNYRFPPCGGTLLIFSETSLRATATTQTMPFRVGDDRRKQQVARGTGPKAAGPSPAAAPRKLGRSAPLVVALHDFTFGGQPIFRLTTRTGFALLVEFVGATPDFVFDVDRNNILARLGLSDFELPGFRSDFVFQLNVARCRLGCDCIHARNAGRIVDAGWFLLARLDLPPEVDFLAIFGYSCNIPKLGMN